MWNDDKTYTGLTMQGAIELMKKELPPTAYKPIPGKTYLTDINSAYLTEVLTNAFGPCGIGWGYDYDPLHLTTVSVEKTSAAGRKYTEHTASLRRLNFWYAYYSGPAQDKLTMGMPIPVSGGSSNDDIDFAVRGAITNAVGAAAAKLCWQIHIYKNEKHPVKVESAPVLAEAPKAKQPWYERALESVRNAAATRPDIWSEPLGKSPAGQKTIELMLGEIGKDEDKWWAAKPHYVNAIKRYTGYSVAEEMTWKDFRNIVRIYASHVCAEVGDTIADVTYKSYLSDLEWAQVVVMLNLPMGTVISTEKLAEAWNIGIMSHTAMRGEEGKDALDTEGFVNALRELLQDAAVVE